ncbi:MAG: hypothetical protein CBE24_07635 [bacterium TMED264]|nr:MAG: hypothetical protein CBE24_07635 [bacterium TMED264]
MLINYSWIIRRRRILFSAIVDFLLIIYFYNLVHINNFQSYPNKFVTFCISAFWIIISYIIGRYMRIKDLNRNGLIKNLVKIISLFLLCNFVYLIFNYGLIILFDIFLVKIPYQNFDRLLFYSFFESLIAISLVSYFFQYILSIVTHKLYKYDKNWIYIGCFLNYEEILEELSSSKSNLKLILKKEDENLNVIKSSSIEGIVIDSFANISVANLEAISKLKLRGIKVITALNWFEKELNRIPTNIIYDRYQLIEKIKSSEYNYQLRIKRMGDIIVSLLLIFFLSPIFISISILIFLEDRNSIFYTQRRTGLNGRTLKIIKFRSMKINAEKDGIQWSSKNDNRITKVGKLIRATRLDELPQLFCVIKGDMSLIGPRPERPEIEKEFLKDIPYYDYRNVIKPGLSGWAQVNYPYGASVFDSGKKLSYDIYYITNFSFFLDLLILFQTIKIIFNLKGYKPD